MLEILSIPEERKAVLIGRNGRTKSEIERKTGTKINIKEDVEIRGEPLSIERAREIVKAIGRGFSPQRAFKLLDEDFRLSVITLRESPKKTKRLLSRVIGKRGKARKTLEELTGCCLSVYGKTICLIGRWDEIDRAVEAVEEILEGRPHPHVYRNLRKS